MDLESSFELYIARAPHLLAEIEKLLKVCQEMNLSLPAGIKNLCQYTWEELSTVPPGTRPYLLLKSPTKAPKSSSKQASVVPVPKSRVPAQSSKVLISNESATSLRAARLKLSSMGVKKRSAVENQALDQGSCFTISSTLRLCMEEHLSNLSFSLAYKENGDIPPLVYMNPKTLEVYQWAINKLKPILSEIKERKDEDKEKGHDRPLILLLYGDKKRTQTPSSTMDRLLPVIPSTRHLGGILLHKLHYALPDGTNFIYYPSGHVAICQVPCPVTRSGTYTNLFSDHPYDTLLASFTPKGLGFVYHPSKYRSSNLALIVNEKEGVLLDKEGNTIQSWLFKTKQVPEALHNYQINDHITLKIGSYPSMSLTFTWQNEAVTLHLREQDTVKSPAHRGNASNSPTAQYKKVDICAELPVLKKKIQEISMRWMEYYLVATGIQHELSNFHLKIQLLPIELDMKRHLEFHLKTLEGFGGTEVTPDVKSAPPIWRRKAVWTSPRKDTGREEVHKGVLRPVPLKRKRAVCRPATSCIPRSDPVFTHRVKSEVHPQATSLCALPSWASHLTACPAILRRLLSRDYEGLVCCCSDKIPLVTDLEFDMFTRSSESPQGHVIVICVSSSLKPCGSQAPERVLQRMHHDRVRASSSPCSVCSQDPYRLIKYDINTASRSTGTSTPLLVERHNVSQGTLLMYAGGKLIFGGTVLNGYGFSKTNLLKQIAKTRRDYEMGHFLPDDYKLRSPAARMLAYITRTNNRDEFHLTETAGKGSPESFLQKENLTPPGIHKRQRGGSALDFILRSLSDRDCILAMESA